MRTSNANAPGSRDFPADPSLEELNAKYAVVQISGTVRVMHFDRSGMPVYQTIPDFIQFHHRRTKKDENDKPISVGKWWIAHPERRQHSGVVFDWHRPDCRAAGETVSGIYPSGFAHRPPLRRDGARPCPLAQARTHDGR
jgi:hypothetical protein